MADISIPEAWIGDDIVVLVGDGFEPFNGPLLEVNDRGVVIDYLLNQDELEKRIVGGEEREAVHQDMKFVDMFVPWRRISGINRSRS